MADSNAAISDSNVKTTELKKPYEIRSSRVISNCWCTKRNGLQSECNRSECRNKRFEEMRSEEQQSQSYPPNVGENKIKVKTSQSPRQIEQINENANYNACGNIQEEAHSPRNIFTIPTQQMQYQVPVDNGNMNNYQGQYIQNPNVTYVQPQSTMQQAQIPVNNMYHNVQPVMQQNISSPTETAHQNINSPRQILNQRMESPRQTVYQNISPPQMVYQDVNSPRQMTYQNVHSPRQTVLQNLNSPRVQECGDSPRYVMHPESPRIEGQHIETNSPRQCAPNNPQLNYYQSQDLNHVPNQNYCHHSGHQNEYPTSMRNIQCTPQYVNTVNAPNGQDTMQN